MNYQKNKFGAFVTDRATQSYLNFSNELSHSEFLILMFSIGGEYLEDDKEQVKKGLIELYEEPGNEFAENLVQYFKSETADRLVDIRTYEQFYGQMAYARTVDNVLTYFKEILGEVIIRTPQILKSKEQERLDFILNYDSIEELRMAIAEKKIEALFYAGIDKIEDFFKERLGIELFKHPDDRKEFNQAVKNRNIVVHNRGRITKEYLKEFPKSGIELSLNLYFTYEKISEINLLFSNFLLMLDNEIAAKFHLDMVTATGDSATNLS